MNSSKTVEQNSRAEINDFTRQVVMTILRIMGKLRHSGAVIPAEIELSYSQILVLYALLETGTATMGQLSGWLQITQGVATRIVDRLLDKELVERKRDDKDRRVVFVSLSKVGREYAEKMIAIHLEKMDEVFLSIDREAREGFLDLLTELDRRLDE